MNLTRHLNPTRLLGGLSLVAFAAVALPALLLFATPLGRMEMDETWTFGIGYVVFLYVIAAGVWGVLAGGIGVVIGVVLKESFRIPLVGIALNLLPAGAIVVSHLVVLSTTSWPDAG